MMRRRRPFVPELEMAITVDWAWAKVKRACGPAISPRATSGSTGRTEVERCLKEALRRPFTMGSTHGRTCPRCGLRADRSRRPRAHRRASTGQKHGGPMGISRAERSRRAREPEETVIRELKEELGIDVKEPCLAPFTFASHSYPDFQLLMPLYVCRRWEGFVAPLGRTGNQMGASTRSPAIYKMPPADLPLIPMLRDLL